MPTALAPTTPRHIPASTFSVTSINTQSYHRVQLQLQLQSAQLKLQLSVDTRLHRSSVSYSPFASPSRRPTTSTPSTPHCPRRRLIEWSSGDPSFAARLRHHLNPSYRHSSASPVLFSFLILVCPLFSFSSYSLSPAYLPARQITSEHRPPRIFHLFCSFVLLLPSSLLLCSSTATLLISLCLFRLSSSSPSAFIYPLCVSLFSRSSQSHLFDAIHPFLSLRLPPHAVLSLSLTLSS